MRVPKLRFPEFRDGGEWERKSLSEIGSRITDKVGKLVLPTVSISAGIGFVLQAEKFGRDISGEQYKNYIVLNAGEFAYNKGNSKKYPQGCIYKLVEFKRVAAPNAFILFKMHDGYISDFFKLYFEANYHGEQLKKFITSGARSDGLLNINPKDFFSISFPSPKKFEQQKIADCLSSLDELISSSNKKLDDLKLHKKGIMQQLFPAKDETVPHLRFPEFRDAGEWQKNLLGNQTMKIGSGVTPLGGDSNYGISGHPFVRSQNVGWGVLILDDIVFIDEDIHQNSISTEILQNDVLLNITGASIGRSAVADARVIGGNVNQHVCIIRLFEKILNPVFLNQYLISEYGQKQIYGFQAGGNRQGLNFAQIRSFEISFPSLLEQQKIADCLSSLDDLITAQTRKIEALKTHKKGLMQQLFPQATETI